MCTLYCVCVCVCAGMCAYICNVCVCVVCICVGVWEVFLCTCVHAHNYVEYCRYAWVYIHNSNIS